MSWSIEESAALYNLPGWGKGVFTVNKAGHLTVQATDDPNDVVDVYDLLEELQERGLELPMLLRFPQIAERRLQLMHGAFREAAASCDFKGTYRPVYPIKVNQQADLVRNLVDAGAAFAMGLEAGSKPELLASMASLSHPDSLLVCNGYKDRAYIGLAMDAQRLGRRVILVIEKLSELPVILEEAEKRGQKPVLGVRARLSRPGAGRWKKSSGDKAKFGLSAGGILALVERLREAEMLDCLQLLHFHIGSQVSNIRTFKRALREGTRLYTELVNMGAPMGTFDVGGGLGIDYDGSATDFESSVNYTTNEYMVDVVSAIAEACDKSGLPHPDLVTESGRATIAHSSVLLFDILGVERSVRTMPDTADEEPAIITELREYHDGLNARNARESWHDIRDGRERARQAFELGVVSLTTLGKVEQIYWACADRIEKLLREQTRLPEELAELESMLADTYYGNFSLFQSIPDSWAIDQLFPVLPIHRLNEEPSGRAVIADLTCDSDGRIDSFVHPRDVKRVLEVHPLRKGEQYVLAVCLVGAYQEILGDLHNLFGDTHAVHVRIEGGAVDIERVVDGDEVEKVLQFVQYERKDLLHAIRRHTEAAITQGKIQRADAARVVANYRQALDSYTYLER